MMIEIYAAFISTFFICIVFVKALAGRVLKHSLIICLLMYLTVYFLSKIFMSQSNFNMMFAILAISFPIFVPIITIKSSKKFLLMYLSLTVLGFVTSLSSLLQWMLSIVAKTIVTVRIADLITHSLILFILLLTMNRKSFYRFIHSISNVPLIIKGLLLGSIWSGGLLASLFSRFYFEYNNLPGIALVGLLTAILIILVGIICPLLIINTLSNLHYKNLAALMDKQVRLQVLHYERLSEANINLKKFKHDYSNMRVGLIGLLNRADIAGAMTLLSADEIISRELTVEYETGCHVLDALLNEKQASAATINASIEFDGVVPGNLLNPADVCVIFGNTLDNAIEACAKCSAETNKIITVQSSFVNGFLFIKVENPVASDVLIANNTIATTKKNANAHGIGLQTIQTSVDKYSGVLALSCENSIFTIQIDLDLNE